MPSVVALKVDSINDKENYFDLTSDGTLNIVDFFSGELYEYAEEDFVYLSSLWH